jgi:hypothetical protein
MAARTNRQFVCPNCGESIPADSKACPVCGSDEQTGWSEETYLDGVDLSEDGDYDEMVRREFGGHPAARTVVRKWWPAAVAALLLLLAGLGLLLQVMRR